MHVGVLPLRLALLLGFLVFRQDALDRALLAAELDDGRWLCLVLIRKHLRLRLSQTRGYPRLAPIRLHTLLDQIPVHNLQTRTRVHYRQARIRSHYH
jgi:hypothetical protein